MFFSRLVKVYHDNLWGSTVTSFFFEEFKKKEQSLNSRRFLLAGWAFAKWKKWTSKTRLGNLSCTTRFASRMAGWELWEGIGSPPFFLVRKWPSMFTMFFLKSHMTIYVWWMLEKIGAYRNRRFFLWNDCCTSPPSVPSASQGPSIVG